MNNPFANVDISSSSIKKQQKKGENIVTKKRGRPRRPNMVKKLIKVDSVLYQQVARRAFKENTTIAAILYRALKKELNLK